MAIVDVDQPSGVSPPEVMQFGCPSCSQELSIPSLLAGVEGPCPICQTEIVAPIPSAGLPARLLSEPHPVAESAWPQPKAEVDPPARVPVPPPPSVSEPVVPTPDNTWERSGETHRAARPEVAAPPEAPANRLPTPPETSSMPEASELRHVFCLACGCELAIEPALAHLPGGPCPQCQTWIDLQGQTGALDPPMRGITENGAASSTPAPSTPVLEDPSTVSEPLMAELPELDSAESLPPSPRPNPSPPRAKKGKPAWASRKRPLGAPNKVSGPVELNGPGPQAGELNFPRMIPETPSPPPGEERVDANGEPVVRERRRVKKRKRRRQLPPEFYVGQAAGQLDARGQETAGRIRRRQFPETDAPPPRRPEPGPRPSHVPRVGELEDAVELGEDSAWSRWLPVLFGVLVPLVGGLVAVVQFDLIDPAEWPPWGPASAEVAPSEDRLAAGIQRAGHALLGKARESYDGIEQSIQAFFEAETWEDAEPYLSFATVPDNSAAGAFLQMFPREAYRGARIRVIGRPMRIPKTERFLFTTHIENGRDANGEPRLIFLIGEQPEEGPAQLHALQLYQSWKQTLTEFLETSGASPSRFYARVRLVDEPSDLRLPDDGPYAKLEIEDWLAKEPWIKEIYVRKDSWAGTRLLATLSGDWAMAVLELEWLRGPTGDAFVHVAGVRSSNWGDFPE